MDVFQSYWCIFFWRPSADQLYFCARACSGLLSESRLSLPPPQIHQVQSLVWPNHFLKLLLPELGDFRSVHWLLILHLPKGLQPVCLCLSLGWIDKIWIYKWQEEGGILRWETLSESRIINNKRKCADLLNSASPRNALLPLSGTFCNVCTSVLAMSVSIHSWSEEVHYVQPTGNNLKVFREVCFYIIPIQDLVQFS